MGYHQNQQRLGLGLVRQCGGREDVVARESKAQHVGVVQHGGGGTGVASQVKALVWFWLIDETLSANLVYLSVHEIGSTILSGGANEDHDDGVTMVMIKCLDLEKKKEKNKMGSRQR